MLKGGEKMKAELKDIKPTFVSYVKKGANKKTFFFTKSDEGVEPTFEKEIPLIFAKEDPKQLVYGVVYSPDEVDSQGDYATTEEIEKAAHSFLKDARNIDKQHDFVGGAGEVVESYISPAEFTLGDQTIKKGSWVMVTKATDEIWSEVIKGEITGYSMAGKAVRLMKQNREDEQVKGLFEVMKAFFTGNGTEELSIFNQKLKESQKDDLTSWHMTDTLSAALREVLENDAITDKQVQMNQVVDDFSKHLKGKIKVALDSKLLKSDMDFLFAEDKRGDEDMTRQELASMLKEEAVPIREDIKALLAEELVPVREDIAILKKSRALSNQITEEQQQPIQKNKLFSALDI